MGKINLFYFSQPKSGNFVEKEGGNILPVEFPRIQKGPRDQLGSGQSARAIDEKVAWQDKVLKLASGQDFETTAQPMIRVIGKTNNNRLSLATTTPRKKIFRQRLLPKTQP